MANESSKVVSLAQLQSYHNRLKIKIATLEVPNAGNIAYDSSTTYPEASVGNAIKVVVDGEDNRKSTFDTNETARTQLVTDYINGTAKSDVSAQVSDYLAEHFTMSVIDCTAEGTTYPSDGKPEDNKYYKLGSITSLVIKGIVEDNGAYRFQKGVILEFTVPSDCTSFQLSYDADLYWADNNADIFDDGIPQFKASYRYQILIVNDMATVVMFGESKANATDESAEEEDEE